MVGHDRDGGMHRALQVCLCVNEEIIPALKVHARGPGAGNQECISSARYHYVVVYVMYCVHDGTAE